ncbi:MAG: EamA family transporter [Spirochaetes bacterium]|nr:EamA family transporter [Spirochaetota bacterium]
MSLLAVLLVTASVLFHATWNVSLKEESSNAGFLVSFNAAAALVVLPLAVWSILHHTVFLPLMPWLIASSVCNACYYLFLMCAYRAGDFSLAYPVSRSAPIFVVTLAGLFFGERPSAAGLAGIILVVTGCFLLPLEKGRMTLKKLLSPVMVFALLTALCTSGYSLFDKFGSKPAFQSLGMMGTLGYMGLEWFLTVVMLIPLVRIFLRERALFRPLFEKTRKTFFAAFLMTLSYGFVMAAYQYAQTSYVVGFRQMSIVLGVILGAAVLKERVNALRVTGTAIVVAGLVLLALA